MASGASLSGALLDSAPPTHPTRVHLGWNNIIKNDHQRAHCKQITLVGAWRTNSAEGRTRSAALRRSGERASAWSPLFFPVIYTHFSGHLNTDDRLMSRLRLWETLGRLLRDICYQMKSRISAQTSTQSFWACSREACFKQEVATDIYLFN